MRDDGTLTVWCEAVMALRIRVRKSAVVSVMDMVVSAVDEGGLTARSPRALGHSGDEALVGQLAQADPADAELAVDRPRPAAAPAAGVAAGLELGPAPLAHDLGRLGHGSSTGRLTAPARRPRRAPPPRTRARRARRPPGSPP